MKKTILLLLIILSSLLILLFRFKSGNYEYTTFSDAAKFADIGRSLVMNRNYNSDFSNFVTLQTGLENLTSVAKWVPPAMPYSISIFFRIFGVKDISVVATSVFYFLLLVIVFYLLSQKLFGKLIGLLATLTLISNINYLDYALSGGSEVLFALEIILATYLFVLKEKASSIIGIFVLFLMYFTKAQAIIYIFGLLYLYLLINNSFKKASLYFSAVFLIGGLLFIITSHQGLFAISQQLPGVAVSDSLRGSVQNINIVVLIKKLFYNLYNFYRLMPQIINPYLWALFVIGLFRRYKSKTLNALKISTIFMVGTTFLVTAATIPFFRYIHPIVPLVYLFAVETLVWIVGKVVRDQWTVDSEIKYNIFGKRFTVHRSLVISFASSFLILILAVGQTLGVIFLDSRFERKGHNAGKPPLYAELSWILKDETNKDDVVVTNLDTWGSWYGERKTVWFPIEPKQIINSETNEIPFDAIYLTSYLIDDENYYMGDSWRMIFNNPNDPAKWICEGCSKIAEEFVFKGEYSLMGFDNYQNEDSRAILLVKKN